MGDWTSKVGGWVKGITALSLTLVTLGIVWQVLFGNSIPFIGGDNGDIVGNITEIVAGLGSAGLVGLITVGIVVWLFRHNND
jgi:hypothetical protein|tara:strand:- start:1752 stop:1997 length:246 start_codon:yes stop_codon:yes gene_type:complete